MNMLNALSVEVERFVSQAEHLRQIYTETRAVLNEIDYEHHFDPALFKAAAWNAEQEQTFVEKLSGVPRFIVLGASSFAKAAVVNELLACCVLPTVAAEDIAEDGDRNEFWRPLVVRYGTRCSYRRVSLDNSPSDTDPVEYELSNLMINSNSSGSFDSGASNFSTTTVPNSALRYEPSIGAYMDYVELSLAHPLLKDGGEVVVPSYGPSTSINEASFLLDRWCENFVPLLIYVIATPRLTDNDRRDLIRLRQALPDSPVFFIKSQPFVRCDLPESERYSGAVGGFVAGSSSMDESSGSWRDSNDRVGRLPSRSRFIACFSSPSSDSESTESLPLSPHSSHNCSVRRDLVDLGYLSAAFNPNTTHGSRRRGVAQALEGVALSDLVETTQNFPRLIWFVQQVCRSRIINLASQCNRWHCSLLNLFILTAFDMARDQIITPRRVTYARSKENELFNELVVATVRKQDELQENFVQTMKNIQDDVVNEAAELSFEDDEGNEMPCTQANEQIERFVLFKVNAAISESFVDSMQCLHQTFVGTLSRCLVNLELYDLGEGEQKEQSASKALKDLMNAAYSLELNFPAGGSVVQILWRKMKQVSEKLLLSSCHCSFPSFCSVCMSETATSTDSDTDTLNVEGDSVTPALAGASSSLHKKSPADIAWRRQISLDTLHRLSQIKLAKILCTQFRTKVKAAHDVFQSAMDKLHVYHNNRLVTAERERLRLRKQHAPRLARLTMESMAHRDSLTYGMPKLGHEIGRGQYGVVYSCDRWGGFGVCAVKSVVPPDDKHWNDLALEFYYTKSLPEHDRLVKLHGAVIDHNYGGGAGPPAVLLIMERMKRDLYTALRAGLSWPARIQLALDVVEGMRFLHSQGLVHRDIKLKNVLLDETNRGKITDLGFCKPEAMMSGSVVGTPIHMAPELFSGSYDSSVDVYAFGVLFWYICAGHVRLPQAFESCVSKDQLWHSVRKGLRPEQLSNFDAECWSIMRHCWSGDATQRPHLGYIKPRLEKLIDQYESQNPDMMPSLPEKNAEMPPPMIRRPLTRHRRGMY